MKGNIAHKFMGVAVVVGNMFFPRAKPIPVCLVHVRL